MERLTVPYLALAAQLAALPANTVQTHQLHKLLTRPRIGTQRRVHPHRRLPALMVTGLRKNLGLSQSDFAAALGVSISTLSKWETGDRRPDAAAAKLLRILQQKPEYITA